MRSCPSTVTSGAGVRRKVAGTWRAGKCWARYAFGGCRRGVPGLVDFVVGNSPFRAWQVPDELAILGEILQERHPQDALEIGTARGGTLFFLTRLASPQATIATVDLPGGKFGGGYNDIRAWCYQFFARQSQQLHLLRGNSHSSEMFALVQATFKGRQLDYLFIDGDHAYGGVSRDFEMYGPLVKRGGLIAFHDIVEGPSERVGGVPAFWQGVRVRFRYREIIKDARQGGYGIGVLYVD